MNTKKLKKEFTLIKMIKTIIIKEHSWADSKYRTREWESSVKIISWEHDYEKGEYKIVIEL